MVTQVRMNPTMVQSVVTYDTIIEFANPELKLFPGMTAYVTIPVATVRIVLKLPNTTLRYKPPISTEEILARYKKCGIEAEPARSADDPAPTDGARSDGCRYAFERSQSLRQLCGRARRSLYGPVLMFV